MHGLELASYRSWAMKGDINYGIIFFYSSQIQQKKYKQKYPKAGESDLLFKS